MLDQALPYFPRMYDIGTHHAHEEINLLAIDFSTMYFDTLAPMPTWREHYLAHDQTPALRVPADGAEGRCSSCGAATAGSSSRPSTSSSSARCIARSPTPPSW